jgi:hypothetical protein
VSVALKPNGVPAQAYEAWRALRFSLFTTQAILDELRRTLAYPRVLRKYDCKLRVSVLLAELTDEGGRESGAIIPMSMYRTWAERESLWEAFDRAGERMPSYTEEELEDVIWAAISEARGKRRRPRVP